MAMPGKQDPSPLILILRDDSQEFSDFTLTSLKAHLEMSLCILTKSSKARRQLKKDPKICNKKIND